MSGATEEDRVKKHPPPHTIQIQFGSQWSVAKPEVYRYEDQKWIDEFFASGRLRLSTFAKFASYPDEIRGDPNEGRALCYGETGDGHEIFVVQGQGTNAAVFCCSQRLTHELRQAFGRNSAFRIVNTVGFAWEIARQLPGFQHGLEGACIYRARKEINRNFNLDMGKYKRPDGTIDMQMVIDAGNALGGPELLLLKRKQYENQQEYRLLWNLDAIGTEYIDVIAPRARQHCRQIDASDYED